jgi:hypothetical protein
MKTSRLLLLAVLVALCLFLPACKHDSTLLSNGQTIKPQPPRVSCKQPATPKLVKSPREDEWVEIVSGKARLSEDAVTWIASLVATLDKERDYRKVEHGCLDLAEKKGLIQQ